MKININDPVEVVLSQRGAAIYNAHYENRRVSDGPKKEGDTLRDQLWHIMLLFGQHIYLGQESPFEDCGMIICEEKV